MSRSIYLTLEDRIDRIGEFLAKGVYLYVKNEKEGKTVKEQAEELSNRLPDMPSSVADKNR